jgi:hypothetical protein
MHRPQDVTPSHRQRAATLALFFAACFVPSMAGAQVPCTATLPIVERQLLVSSRYVGYSLTRHRPGRNVVANPTRH